MTVRDCSRWHKSRRQQKFRQIKENIDCGLYALAVLRARSERIELDHTDREIREKLRTCVDQLRRIQKTVEKRRLGDKFEVEMAEYVEEKQVNIDFCVRKLEQYENDLCVDEVYPDIKYEIRTVEDFADRRLEHTSRRI